MGRKAQANQDDFTGGENSVADPALLRDDEVAEMFNCFARPQRGAIARKGYKLLRALQNTEPGRAIFEFDQAVTSIVMFKAAGATYYDQTMQPIPNLFDTSPQVGDIVYFGDREPFGLIQGLFKGLPADYTFIWEIWNGTAYIDVTAQVAESVANAKKWGVGTFVTPVEATLSWDKQAFVQSLGWTPNQVNTQGVQYWIRSRLTATGTPGQHVLAYTRIRNGSDGRRLLVAASTKFLWDLPGSTVAAQQAEAFGQVIQRVRAGQLNDFIYYASDGQRPLKRWNGSRGLALSTADNAPANAGLVAPNAAPTVVPGASGGAYAANAVIRYALSFTYGPDGILGESPLSATTETTLGVGFATQVSVPIGVQTQAAGSDVHSILVYATYDLQQVGVSERDDPAGFLLVSSFSRKLNAGGLPEWTGFLADAKNPRIRPGQNPVGYVNTPPFRPIYLTAGGNRLWISDGVTVAWSDIGRGDSWNPTNTRKFGNVRQIIHDGNRCVVLQQTDIQIIEGVDQGLTQVRYLWRGLGCVQPDSVTKGQGAIYFMSRLGPARIVGDQLETLARNRTWESANYWNEKAAERSLAQGAYFLDRWWIPIDQGGPSPFITNPTAVFDAPFNSWSYHVHRGRFKDAGNQPWGALAVIHAPLDHALARQLILVGFPDYDGTNLAQDASKLFVLAYGTTDNWTTLVTDGTAIAPRLTSRGLTMGSLSRWKKFGRFHVRMRLPGVGVGVSGSVDLSPDQGATGSAGITIAADNTKTSIDIRDQFVEAASRTPYREVSPSLRFSGNTDSGWEVTSWYAEAEVDDEIFIGA